MMDNENVATTSARAIGSDERRLTSGPDRCWCDASVFAVFIDSLLTNVNATEVAKCRHRVSLGIRCVQRIADCFAQYSGRDTAGANLSLRGHPWPQ